MNPSSASRDDEGSTEYWRDIRKGQQQFKAKRRETGQQALIDAGVPFLTRNNGAHLIVNDEWDFWPGTGRWSHRSPPSEGRGHGRGVDALLRIIKGNAP